MRIAVGNDHTAVEYKRMIIPYIEAKGHTCIDLGAAYEEKADYPVCGERVARAIADGAADLGVLMCGTGIGISIAANKVSGIRAAVCSEPYSAKMSRAHNDAHIICFGSRVVGVEVAKTIVDAFIETAFEGGRHEKRVEMIKEIEKNL